MTSPPDLKTGPRANRHGKELVPSIHTFALRNPWYWERLRWLRKWTVDKWAKGYVRALGPAGTKGNFEPLDSQTSDVSDPFDRFVEEPPIPFVVEHETRTEVNGLALAEAVSSEDVVTGKHHILIDIDRPCALIPSTSNDHYHLYVQMGSMGNGMRWEDYVEWLRASARIGLIEQGYVDASIRRGATFLRMPWIRRGREVEDRQRALGWWLASEAVDLNGRPTNVPAPL